jgi:vacuolar-type H+-ATPase subunit C/Vma6
MGRGASIYLITRVHGLRTHLITPNDTKSLAKGKTLSDVADNLMKTEYATELSQLPTQERDATTLEGVFLRKLIQRFFFLRRAAQGKMQEILTRYCARFEVENIKRIIRAKHGGTAEQPTLIPLGREYSLVNFPALQKAKDIEEVVSLLRETSYRSIAEKLQAYREAGTTLILEAALDSAYFGRLWEVAKKRKGVKDLIGEEMDLRNLLYVLSLKHAGAASRLIEDAMIPLSYRLTNPTLRSIIQGRLETASSMLPPIYSKLTSEATSMLSHGSSMSVEGLFSQQLYYDALRALRTRSLQAGYIIAYLLLCEAEAKNMISIVTGKQLNLTEGEITRQLFAV